MGERIGVLRFVCAVAVALALGGVTLADIPLFDWQVPPAKVKPGLEKGYIPVPGLSDATAAFVDAFLAGRLAKDSKATLAVKVDSNLTSAAAKGIFNKYKISYVFGDLESADSVARTKDLWKIVNASAKSKSAFVGNFNLYPVSPDPTRPGTSSAAKSFKYTFGKSDYDKSMATMANPSLYPGSPDFVTGSVPGTVRQQLFGMPIERLSLTTDALKSKPSQKNIPYVTRFNNWGNNALDSDHNPNKGVFAKYEFVSNAKKPSDGLLLSRGDFSALMAHYRLRGASSAMLFVPGVVGYTKQQMQDDAFKGWNFDPPDDIFDLGGAKIATTTTTINSDDKIQDIGKAGVVWSGVYNGKSLDVLLSNMDFKSHEVDLPAVNGMSVLDPTKATKRDDFVVEAGTHRLLQFSLMQQDKTHKIWKLISNQRVFTDDNRNGIGIPEPSTLALVGILGLGMMRSRKRRV